MLCLHQRLLRTTTSSVSSASVVTQQQRYYKKQKMSAQQISEALSKKREQKKTLLDTYSKKYGRQQAATNESERDRMLSKARKLKKQKDAEVDEGLDGDDVMPIDQWFDSLRDKHFARPEVQAALSLQLTVEAYNKAMHLHSRDPPNLFKTPVEYMRGLIFEAKIIQEAREKGVPIYDDIEAGFRQLFPTVDMINGFEEKANFDLPIKKIHNPWYFVDPGLKSGELLKFVRSRETRYYREASRIPTQRYPRMQEFPEVLPQGIEHRKFPHKKGKYFLVDSSPCYNLYTRPILIRDHDNTWRTASWEERRHIYNYQRPVKRCPLKVPFVYPDNDQPDRIAIQDKPPAGFDFEGAYTQDDDEDVEEGESRSADTHGDDFEEASDFTNQHDYDNPQEEDQDETAFYEGESEGPMSEDDWWETPEEASEQGGAFGDRRQRRDERGRTGFGMAGKFDLNPKRVAQDLGDREKKTDFSKKWRVKFDYGNTWKDPTIS